MCIWVHCVRKHIWMRGEVCQDEGVFPKHEVGCFSDLFGRGQKATSSRVNEHTLFRGLQTVVVLFEQKSLPTNAWEEDV